MQGHVKGQCGSRPPPALPPGLGAPLLLWAWELLQGGGGGGAEAVGVCTEPLTLE